MFLKNIFKHTKDLHIPFNGINAIYEIESAPKESQEDRFNIILKIIRMSKSLWVSMYRDGDYELTEKDFKKIINDCKTYKNNKIIVWGKLMQIAQSYSFEFLNRIDYDFSLIPLIIKWEKTFKDFIGYEIKNTFQQPFSFLWESLKKYSWHGTGDLYKLKTEDLFDIIKWYQWDNERIKSCIPYILNSNNHDILKKQFSNLRIAMISLMTETFREWKEVEDEKQSKVINFILWWDKKENIDNEVIENPETQETKETHKAPF